MSVKNPEIRSIMNVFERVTEDEIKKLILSSSSKSGNLNPALTSTYTYKAYSRQDIRVNSGAPDAHIKL